MNGLSNDAGVFQTLIFIVLILLLSGCYRPLEKDEILKIIEIQLNELKRVLNEKNIDVSWDEQAIREIQATGYDTNYGARPIKRIIQKRVYDILAEKILSNEIQQGDSICLSADSKGLKIEK